MKRAITPLLAVVLVLCPAIATADVSESGVRTSPASPYWARQWITWAFGSDANPIVTGICGEQIEQAFLLTAAFAPGQTQIDCEVPRGTRLLVSPGGTIRWAPTDGETAAELRASVAADLATISDVQATLDGVSLDLSDAFIETRVFTMPLEPGNFIQTVDPNVVGDEVRVAMAGWFLRIGRLTVGEHVLVLSDVIAGQTFEVTFHLTVVDED
jgi:hypothetical protein